MLLSGAEKWRMEVVMRDVESEEGLIKAGVVAACGPAAAAEERTVPGVTPMNRREGAGCSA